MHGMLFGTFDGLHMGHVWVIQHALECVRSVGGGKGLLYIVVARDVTVHKVKGRVARHGENVRVATLKALFPECRVVLGHMTDYMYWVKKISPASIYLGYDQQTFTDSLAGVGANIVRIQPFNEGVYKSSKIKIPHILIRGEVVHGKKLARSVGYPTANIHLSAPIRRLVAEHACAGIYASCVLLGTKSYIGATVVGARTHKGAPLVETHIIGYRGDCYGHTVTISLEKKLRDFKLYTNDEQLKKDIAVDIQNTQKYFTGF
jgi:cytidyltransferase-like protein